MVEASEANTGCAVATTVVDCAYGDGGTRQAFAEIDTRFAAAHHAVDLFLRPIGEVEVKQFARGFFDLRIAEVVEVVDRLHHRGVVADGHHLDADALTGAFEAIHAEVGIPCFVVVGRSSAVHIRAVLVFRAIFREFREVPEDGEVHRVVVLRAVRAPCLRLLVLELTGPTAAIHIDPDRLEAQRFGFGCDQSGLCAAVAAIQLDQPHHDVRMPVHAVAVDNHQRVV